nr:hypothetical protein [Salinigranum salinum]
MSSTLGGLFESVPANEEVPGGTIEAIAQDIEEYHPDILIHVMTPGQARAGKHDFEAVERLEERIPGGLPPFLYCINQVDNWLPPGHGIEPELEEYSHYRPHDSDGNELPDRMIDIPTEVEVLHDRQTREKRNLASDVPPVIADSRRNQSLSDHCIENCEDGQSNPYTECIQKAVRSNRSLLRN